MTTGRNWHKERLFFLISSARHFAASLEKEGFTVEYVKAATTIDGLNTITKDQCGHCAIATVNLLNDLSSTWDLFNVDLFKGDTKICQLRLQALAVAAPAC
jgi:deoxyribodipyrimidine photolyase-like uncharacterized protein